MKCEKETVRNCNCNKALMERIKVSYEPINRDWVNDKLNIL